MWLNTSKVGHVCGALLKTAVSETPAGQMCPGPPWECSHGVSSGPGRSCQKAALVLSEPLSYFEWSSFPASISLSARCWCFYCISHQLLSHWVMPWELMQKLLQKKNVCLPLIDFFSWCNKLNHFLCLNKCLLWAFSVTSGLRYHI